MRSTTKYPGDTITASCYNDLRGDAVASAMLAPHPQSTPNMMLKVESGVGYVGITRISYMGGNTPTFIAPTTYPRIDLVTMDASGVVAIVQGTPAPSPAIPAYPKNKLVLCEVYHWPGETSIKDYDDGINAIMVDVRPVVTQAGYIADTSQVAAGALTGDKFANLGSIPMGAGTIPWQNLPPFASPKFGGMGTDGYFSISSGTTTLSFGGNDVLVKSYSGVSISGSAVLAFSNPSGNGSIFIMKAMMGVTITSNANPAVDLRNMGGGTFVWMAGRVSQNGGAGGGNPGAGGGSGGSSASEQGGAGAQGYQSTQGGAAPPSPFYTAKMCQFFPYLVTPGANGASGGTWFNQSASHSPGLGAGSMWVECGFSLYITSIFTATGSNGQNATSYGAGDGGGAGGCFVFIYNSLTQNTATFNVGGGLGGGGAQYNGSAGNGANGFYAVLPNITWV